MAHGLQGEGAGRMDVRSELTAWEGAGTREGGRKGEITVWEVGRREDGRGMN